MQHDSKFWSITLVAASFAVAFAAIGLVLDSFAPATPALVTTGLLLASLGSTATAFARIALRVRRLELENEGLVEEISQEFDRVKDKIDILGEGLDGARRITPEEAEAAPMRRVPLK